MSDLSREKIWNIELVVNDIKKIPQTYNTILGDLFKDGTCQFMLRRKMNKLCKEGVIFKTVIPCTRFGKNIFYVRDKNYFILVESSRLGSDVYYFFDYKQISKFYIEVSDCYLLTNNVWKPIGKKIFFEGNVLKWI